MSHSLDVLFRGQAERHRPQAQAFDVAKMRPANARSKVFQLLFDVPLFHSGNIRGADRRISRSVRIVTRDAGLEKFSSSSCCVRWAQAASREAQSADPEQQRTKRESKRNGNLNSVHAQSQRY